MNLRKFLINCGLLGTLVSASNAYAYIDVNRYLDLVQITNPSLSNSITKDGILAAVRLAVFEDQFNPNAILGVLKNRLESGNKYDGANNVFCSNQGLLGVVKCSGQFEPVMKKPELFSSESFYNNGHFVLFPKPMSNYKDFLINSFEAFRDVFVHGINPSKESLYFRNKFVGKHDSWDNKVAFFDNSKPCKIFSFGNIGNNKYYGVRCNE